MKTFSSILMSAVCLMHSHMSTALYFNIADNLQENTLIMSSFSSPDGAMEHEFDKRQIINSRFSVLDVIETFGITPNKKGKYNFLQANLNIQLADEGNATAASLSEDISNSWFDEEARLRRFYNYDHLDIAYIVVEGKLDADTQDWLQPSETFSIERIHSIKWRSQEKYSANSGNDDVDNDGQSEIESIALIHQAMHSGGKPPKGGKGPKCDRDGKPSKGGKDRDCDKPPKCDRDGHANGNGGGYGCDKPPKCDRDGQHADGQGGGRGCDKPPKCDRDGQHANGKGRGCRCDGHGKHARGGKGDDCDRPPKCEQEGNGGDGKGGGGKPKKDRCWYETFGIKGEMSVQFELKSKHKDAFYRDGELEVSYYADGAYTKNKSDISSAPNELKDEWVEQYLGTDYLVVDAFLEGELEYNYYIRNPFTGQYLYDDGDVVKAANKPKGLRSFWTFEDVGDFKRIRNVGTNDYIHTEDFLLFIIQATPAPEEWVSSQWTFEDAEGYKVIKNNLTGNYVTVETGGIDVFPEYLPSLDGKNESKWVFELADIQPEYFNIKNKHSGCYLLDFNDAAKCVMDPAGKQNADWFFDTAKYGIRLKNRQTGDYVHSESQLNYVEATTGKYTWLSAQWGMEENEDGSVRFVNVATGDLLYFVDDGVNENASYEEALITDESAHWILEPVML